MKKGKAKPRLTNQAGGWHIQVPYGYHFHITNVNHQLGVIDFNIEEADRDG